MHTTAFALTTVFAVFAASNVALAQSTKEQTGAKSAATAAPATAAAPEHSKSLDHLMRAAQRLRETIQALAQQEPGPRRDNAIKAAQDALFDTQQAMIQLPPELRSAPAPKSAGGVAPEYRASLAKLQKAADRLRESVQAMATQPAGDRRNSAMQEAREALLETQQAMVYLPIAAAEDKSGTRKAAAGEKDREAGTKKTAAADKERASRMQGPVLVLFPQVLVVDEKLASGCWARLYEEEKFKGEFVTLVGPSEFASMDTGFGNMARKWDSVIVGPKATLTAYDNENYAQRVATFKSGQRVPDLDEKLGFFENIRSAKVTCSA